MKLSTIPDWGSRRRLMLGALIVWLLALVAVVPALPNLARVDGDTDDALRLAIVRELAGGRGWFDQRLERLQPPNGLYIHWSRLVDGSEAALLKLFGVFFDPARAELAMRAAWPSLGVFPLTIAVMLFARRLGGGRAAFLAIVTAGTAFYASGEFSPGRIDHHGVQIACCIIASAAAIQRPSARWAAICGGFSALGLAVGLEALPFLAIVGAAQAGLWAWRRLSGRGLAAYGGALGLGAAVLHLAQTPPDRWAVPACDALAVNLVAGLAAAAVSLCGVTVIGARLRPAPRLGLVVAAAGVAAPAYLGVDPACVRGPMADMDPELGTLWLTHVREMTPWLTLLWDDPALALKMGAPAAAGFAGWLWLGRRREAREDPAWMLAGVLLLAAAVVTVQAARFGQYAIWFAAPLAAAGLADFAAACLCGLMTPAVLLFVAAVGGPGLAFKATGVGQGPSGPTAGASCNQPAELRTLADQKPGLVLAEVDLGPYILARTPHSALQAPYHRVAWGIGQARAILSADVDTARQLARARGVLYVANCAAHADQADRRGLPNDSLQRALDGGRVPAWLERLSPPDAPLQVYRLTRTPLRRISRLGDTS